MLPKSSGGCSEGLGLFDQHDRNPVFDRIYEATRGADQRLGRRPILQLTLALWAHQDLEEFRSQGHLDLRKKGVGKTESGESSSVGPPMREHPNPEIEIDRRAKQLFHAYARLRPDGLDDATTRTDDDSLL